MSQANNQVRSLPSPPPIRSGRASLDGRSVIGSRPLSVVSSQSHPGLVTSLDHTNNASSSAISSAAPVVVTYNVFAGNAMVDLIIRITTPKNSRDSTLTLTCQAGGVERVMGEPQTVQFSTDPAQAEFIVYFIPRESPPLNASFKFRVWLSSPGLQVRLWAEDEFWVGAQLPFPSIPGAHLARLAHSSSLFHTYHGTVGGSALVYTVSIDQVPYAPAQDEYMISLRYESSGISRELCSNLRVRLSCGVENISFIIYSIRQNSEPKGGRHKFRFWIRSAIGGICQRLWAADDVWIGKSLQFESVQQGAVIFARRSVSGLASARADPFSDPSDLPAYSPNPPADEYQ